MRTEKTFTVSQDIVQELAQTINHFFCEDKLSSVVHGMNDLFGSLIVLETDESRFECRHSYITESIWHVSRLTNLLVKLYELNKRIESNKESPKPPES